MLNTIKRFFDHLAPETGQTDEQKQHAIHLAVSVLFVEMIRMDGIVSAEENRHLQTLLGQKFSLSENEKQNLTELANEKLDDSVDYYQFTTVINEHFKHDEKVRMIEHLWQLAFIDGRIDAHEEHFLRKIHSLLHVTHTEFIKAKHRAERKADVKN